MVMDSFFYVNFIGSQRLNDYFSRTAATTCCRFTFSVPRLPISNIRLLRTWNRWYDKPDRLNTNRSQELSSSHHRSFRSPLWTRAALHSERTSSRGLKKHCFFNRSRARRETTLARVRGTDSCRPSLPQTLYSMVETERNKMEGHSGRSTSIRSRPRCSDHRSS